MKDLRKRIKSSFGNITAFLMPHPGMKVAEGRSNGNLKDVDPKFKKYVKELVPDLLAPENLIIKKIAGQKLRISDLVPSLQTYFDILLNLPKPESIFAVIFIFEYSLISEIIFCNEFARFYRQQQNLAFQYWPMIV